MCNRYLLTVKQALIKLNIDINNKCLINDGLFELDNIELKKGPVLIIIPDGESFIKSISPLKKISLVDIRDGKVKKLFNRNERD